jgi:hypothetical protein
VAQPNRVPTGLPYGQAGQLAAAQRAIPLPQADTWEAPVIPLDAPTQRPDEPVTDGVPIGPGRSPVEAGIPGANEDTTTEGILNTLRGILQAYPLPSIAQAIADFATNPPWSIEDLFLDFGPPPRDEDELIVRGPPPELGGLTFDESAPLDTSMVEDVRAETGAAAAATGGVIAGGILASPSTTEPMIEPEAAQLPDVPDALMMGRPR